MLSDIYSLGVLLWELVSCRSPRAENGRRQFDHPANECCESDRRLLENVHNIAANATRESPAERYQSAEALAGRFTPRSGRRRHRALRRQWTAAGACSSATGLHRGVAVSGVSTPAPDRKPISEWASRNALITRLSNIGRIAVRPTGAVLRFAGSVDPADAGLQLNVKYVPQRPRSEAGERVRVTVQLVATESRAPVWAAGFEDQLGDLLKMEDSISEQVAQALIPQMTGEEREQLARTGTASAKAHEAYLRGRWYWSRHTEDALPQALVLFSAAIAEDPDYSRAHAGIADYHIALGMRGLLPPAEAFGAAIDCARRALKLDPKLVRSACLSRPGNLASRWRL